MGASLIAHPGCYAIPAADYLADPCVTPSLSSSLAHILLTQSPRHAREASPRLNPEHKAEESEAFDVGRAAHSYLLEGKSAFVLIDAPDFKTKAAREARDAARKAGKIPLLAHRYRDVQDMAAAARMQLAGFTDGRQPFTDGLPEQTLVWQEGTVWCRARLDWLSDDRRWVDDYKSTSGSANPASWTRGALYANGYDVQAAFYLRGVRAVFGVDAEFRFVVQETYAPHALAVIGLGPEAMALAHKKVDLAISIWRTCLEAGVWPAYPERTCWAELPPWEEARFLESEAWVDATAVPRDPDPSRDIADVLFRGD